MEILLTEEKIKKARQGVLLDQRFFAVVGFGMDMVEDNNQDTGWTNGKEIGWNRQFIDSLTLPETKFFILHEILHVAMLHHLRRGNRDKERWQKACDYAVNQICIDCGYPMIEGGLYDPRFNGLSVEEIYEILKKEDEEEEDRQQKKQQQQKGSESGGGQGDKNQGSKSQDQEGDQEEGETGIPGKEEDKDSGDGQQDQRKRDPGRCGEVRDAVDDNGKPADEAEIARQTVQMKGLIQQASEIARGIGQLSPGVERVVRQLVHSQADWKSLLKPFVEQFVNRRYTWNRPNRRLISQGIYLPSRHSKELGKIVIGIDTSGSISMELYTQFMSEMKGILDEYNVEVTVIFCDDHIRNVEQVTAENIMEIKPSGFGGTDFRPVFDWVEENAIDPVCLLYFTDLDGYFPQHEPSYPVLWAAYNKRSRTAPFGETIEIKP